MTESGYDMPPHDYLFESLHSAKEFVRDKLGEPNVEFWESNGEYHPAVSILDYGLTIVEVPIYGDRG